MSKFRGDKLIKMADFLVEESKKPVTKTCKFDMETFGYLNNEGDGSNKIEMSCNTSACALGSVAIAKVFPDLKYRFDAVDNYIYVYLTKRDGYTFHDLEAAEELFGISEDESDYLFMSGSYPEKYQKGTKAEKYVAARIYKFVELKEKEMELVKGLSILNKERNKINLDEIDISA